MRYVRSLHPAHVRIAVVLDNFSPHVSHDIRTRAEEHNVELAFVPFYASWLNRIEAQFALSVTSPSTAPTSPPMRNSVG